MKKSPDKPIILAIALIVAAMLSSCVGTASFNYTIIPGSVPQYAPLPRKISIAVPPFIDGRPKYQNIPDSQYETRGSFASGWIPLMPYGWIENDFPEQNLGQRFATLNSYWCQFDRELAQSTVDSLEFCGLFDDVQRVESVEQAETDWIFRGTYTITEYQGERLTYGITYLAAPVLWVLGFPCAVSHCRLALNFEIIERSTGNLLWSNEYNDSDFTVQGLYYNYGKDTQRFTKLANYALGAAIFDLKQKMDAQQDR